MKIIDNTVIEAALYCNYKAFLKYHKESGAKSDYELLESDLSQRYKADFFPTLRVQPCEHQILEKPKLNNNTQYRQLAYAIEPIVQSGLYSICFDALEIRPARDCGNIASYIPIAISPKEQLFAVEKLLLCTKTLIFDKLNGIRPEYGKIIYGKKLRATKFALKPYSHKAAQVIKHLENTIDSEDPPKLYRNSHCQVCEYQNTCRAQLLEKDDLSLLGTLGQKEAAKLANKGIFTIYQLSYTYRPKKRKTQSVKSGRVEYPLKALALREKKTYIIDIPTLPASQREVYIDVEGLPHEYFFYLIGVLVIQNGMRDQFSFWADSQKDIETMFAAFIKTLFTFDDFTIYHYGSYETSAIEKINRVLNNKFDKEVELIIQKSINILSLFSSHIYPPTYTNSLKDIARFIGFEWADAKASGIQSIVWRKRWELTGESTYKNSLIQYNKDDCEALFLVKEWIARFKDKLDNTEDESVIKTTSIQTQNYRKWGNPNFQTQEFEEINECSYFDYQRNKIYLRTNKNVKKALRRAKKHRKYANKPDKALEYLPMECPACHHDKFYQLKHSRSKLVINLKFMRNGVKKWNTKLPGFLFQCAGCGEEFALQKYGRNLAIWSMNQYLTYLTSMPKIGEMLLESFNIHVPEAVLYQFKTNLAEEYKSTYMEIKKSLIVGHLIHADETKTPTRECPNGYVWVLTSMDAVYYFYKPNREAGFLIDLLQDFHGVLISDFYSGYSSIPCQQQKCLIHLIRDLNGDLLNNQFNAEYRNIVTEFGKLLRSIIGTIDRYGLKKRHLHKHEKDVETFFDHILSGAYETELAISWQKRFKRNREKLFNFLNFDDVPWNNNNGENAIKPVAKYRARAKGLLRESGIKDFLILLSIQQTCKYRGISFLDFLKSRDKSIEEYCRKH